MSGSPGPVSDIATDVVVIPSGTTAPPAPPVPEHLELSLLQRHWVATVTVAMFVSLIAPLAPASAAQESDWPVVVRDGTWHLRQAYTAGDPTASWNFGESTDIPLFGDWDGDGVASSGVYRDGAWFLTNTNGSSVADIEFFYGGRSGDFPVVGDWDGDGVDTVGVIRGGTWHLVNEFRGGDADVSFTYGRVGPRGDDIPLTGDWDGDGVDTVGIVRDGTWHLRNTNTAGPGEVVFVFGRVGPRGDDLGIVGDWDGDGKDTVGVIRGKRWYLHNVNADGAAEIEFDYGIEEDWRTLQGGFAETTRQQPTARVEPADLSPEEAIRAWFPEDGDKAVQVADCESSLNPHAVSPNGAFHGLFQVSDQWHREAFFNVTGQRWDEGIYTSYYNAQYARHLYEGQGWSPWPHCGQQ